MASRRARPRWRPGYAPEASEATTQKAVLSALAWHPAVAWVERTNTGGAYLGTGSQRRFVRFNPPGWSDITGQLRDGRFLAVECKRIGEEATDAQRIHLARVNAAGGLAFIAYGTDDVQRALAHLIKR